MCFSSPKPTAHVSYSNSNLSVVRCRRCRKHFEFSSSSPQAMGQFRQNLAQSILKLRDSRLFKGRVISFPRGDNNVIAKIHRQHLKIFFSRTVGPTSTKLGTKNPWVEGIQVCPKFPWWPLRPSLLRNPVKRSFAKGVVILDNGHHLTSHPTDISSI